ncbi:UrcA family protein [Erythrobacter sp. SG61-1L]|uniref:UrcA family protein n=1 Tax=Erythrobacter sp. SG61-1L TaxID=1603897 RepID=UPI0006C8F1B1|nr:UrcA family protein [Erythrobacter sp. SG61-1L]
MKRSIMIIAAAVGTLVAAQPAFAEAATVSFKDLDLSTEKGRKELDRRIDNAAKDVCGYNVDRTGSRVPSNDARKCYKEARKKIETRIATLTETSNNTAGS